MWWPLWRECVPAFGTVVEAYLLSRGLELIVGAPLRFHPRCPRCPRCPRGATERLPAMVALMTDPVTGEPCGIHRTFLRSDGSGKAEGQAKMMAGSAGVIRLLPDEDVTLGFGLVEGIETGLSVMQRYGWRPIWAATSAGGIAHLPPLPGIEAVTIFADADGAGHKAAAACASHWIGAGREARINLPPAGDFNDLHRSGG